MANGDDFEVTTDVGNATSDPIVSAPATALAVAGTYLIPHDMKLRVNFDGGGIIEIDLTNEANLAAVIATINGTPGITYVMASDNGGELELISLIEGTDASLDITNGTGPWIIAGNSELYALAHNQTLDVDVDGVTQTITFFSSEFADITNATAAEVVSAMNLKLAGATAFEDGTGVRLHSDTLSGGSIAISGGTAAAAFSFGAGPGQTTAGFLGLTAGIVSGTGNVGNVGVVTLEDIAGIVNNSASIQAIAGEFRAIDNGRIYSRTDNTGTVEAELSPVQAATGMPDNAPVGPTGVDVATDETFESEWLAFPFVSDWASVTEEFASFDSGSPELFEDFEDEWGNTPYLLNWAAVTPDDFLFNVGVDAEEEFNGVEPVLVTVDPALDRVEISPDPFANDDQVRFTNEGGVLPSGILPGVFYFVVNRSVNHFQIAVTMGGAAVDITDFGFGTHYASFDPIDVWVDFMETL
jgi:hypothetical protein